MMHGCDAENNHNEWLSRNQTGKESPPADYADFADGFQRKSSGAIGSDRVLRQRLRPPVNGCLRYLWENILTKNENLKMKILNQYILQFVFEKQYSYGRNNEF